jgi:prevent-host-death family protein
MREIAVTDAKAKLLQYLDEVEHGETLRITRRGKAIARIVPERQLRSEEIAAAVAGIRAIGRRTQGMSSKEMLAAREAKEEDRRR